MSKSQLKNPAKKVRNLCVFVEVISLRSWAKSLLNFFKNKTSQPSPKLKNLAETWPNYQVIFQNFFSFHPLKLEFLRIFKVVRSLKINWKLFFELRVLYSTCTSTRKIWKLKNLCFFLQGWAKGLRTMRGYDIQLLNPERNPKKRFFSPIRIFSLIPLLFFFDARKINILQKT